MIRRFRHLTGRELGALVLASALVVVLAAAAAVATDAGGAGDRFESLVARVELFLDPPPDRPIQEAVLVTPRPSAPQSPRPATPRPDPSALPASVATPEPTPARVPVDRTIVDDPDAHFAPQADKDWCAPAGVQMVLATLGLADTSEALQREIAARVGEWESWRDSHNGEWGPSAMVAALDAYGAEGYQLRAYQTRQDALRDAAVAIDATGSPVVLLAWRGAHTWVMTGYRADADPMLFADAVVDGGYVLDPWYPRDSSIWGPSDPPNTYQDAAEMVRNFLPWKRPEGLYPERDGLFIAVVPTVAVAGRQGAAAGSPGTRQVAGS